MSLSLATKISSLLWIPNGEVDDTRFEKLFDDLAKQLQEDGARLAMIQEGLLPTLIVRSASLHLVDLTLNDAF